MGSAQADTGPVVSARFHPWVTGGADGASGVATHAGEPGGTGMAHRNAVGAAATVVAAVERAPASWTDRPSSRSSTSTEPSWSVRYTLAPLARSRSSVDLAGCPYGLPAPADAIATFGRTASTNGWVDAVALP